MQRLRRTKKLKTRENKGGDNESSPLGSEERLALSIPDSHWLARLPRTGLVFVDARGVFGVPRCGRRVSGPPLKFFAFPQCLALLRRLVPFSVPVFVSSLFVFAFLFLSCALFCLLFSFVATLLLHS